ncbi:helix-turn-helix domain-containing protein [Massilibacteroides vaginae]|uniref:helix-turn-helix domain-containing protein n=1 Tax=Massilibacteroides vaginae TaxID=1673718 RepID=UPI00111C3135|nr:helix-turn-helix domain-containing protein [Massilibacteroides vaginae]
MNKENRTDHKKKHQGKVFTITDFVLGNLSEINQIREGEISIHGGMAMCTCTKGAFHFSIGNKNYTLTERQIFTFLPRQAIKIISQSDDFSGEILVFPVDLMPAYLSPINYEVVFRIIENPVLSVSLKTMQSILQMHALIVESFHNKEKIYKEEIVKALVLAMVLEVGSEYAKHQQMCLPAVKTRKEELTEAFIVLLLTHYKVGHSVAFYAKKMGITPKYLSATIKEIIGLGALDCINEAVMAKIKSSLRNSQQTVLQISEEFNFPNSSFFGRYFKQHTGETPLQYRHRNQ